MQRKQHMKNLYMKQNETTSSATQGVSVEQLNEKAKQVFDGIMSNDKLSATQKLDFASLEMNIFWVAAELTDKPLEEVWLEAYDLSSTQVQRVANYAGRTVYRWYDEKHNICMVAVKECMQRMLYELNEKTLKELEKYVVGKIDRFYPQKDR